MKTILYISDVNSNEPIFHSQVVPHVNALKKYYKVILLGMSRNDNFNYDFAYNSVKGDMHLPIAFYNFIQNKKITFKFLDNSNIDLIYSRGFRGGILGILLKKKYFNNSIKVINDVRADILDEHKENFINKNSFYLTSKYVINNSDVLFFVSTYLKNKYVKKFKFNGVTEICPTFVPDGKFIYNEEVRKNIRKQLDYSDQDIVLLYSGNLAKWQNVEVILDAFEKTTNPLLKLLILTKDKGIKDIINNHSKKEKIQTLSVNYDQIQDYYYASDYGLLIRDNTPTNICSAPTKFSEYINSGLNILGTQIDSDYCSFLKQNRLDNYLIKNKDELDKLFNVLDQPTRNNIEINTLSSIVNKQKLKF